MSSLVVRLSELEGLLERLRPDDRIEQAGWGEPDRSVPGEYRYTVFSKGPLVPGDATRLLEFLIQAGLNPVKVAVAGGRYLERTRRLRFHYAVMERATQGYQGFAREALRAAARLAPALTPENSMGGYPLVQRYGHSEEFHRRWFANASSVLRLGPGTRAIRVEDLAPSVLLPPAIRYLINANIPQYMDQFEQPDFRTILLEVSGKPAPITFREQILGEEPVPGSLREYLPNLNCHGSAGVIEAIVEDGNLGERTVPLSHPLVSALTELGLERSRLRDYLGNPDIRWTDRDGSLRTTSVFDATEKISLQEVARRLGPAELLD